MDKTIVINVDGDKVNTSLVDVAERSENDKAISEKINKLIKINELKQLLSSTDYIGIKITEAMSKFFETNLEEDLQIVKDLRSTYARELADRESWRIEVRKLEEEIKEIKEESIDETN